MKILTILLLAFMFASCGNDNRQESRANEERVEESVEPGARENISPQLEMDSTNEEFEVDTISSPAEADRQAEDGL